MIGSDSSIFTLQYQLSIDSNSGVGFNTGSTGARQQFVGLSSATLGTVALGRQHAPRYQASNIHLAYAQLDWDQGNCYVGISHACGLTGSTKSATLAWTTALSKRTTLYAGYVWNDNDKNTALTATGGSAGPVAGIGAVNQTNQTILGGIRHTF